MNAVYNNSSISLHLAHQVSHKVAPRIYELIIINLIASHSLFNLLGSFIRAVISNYRAERRYTSVRDGTYLYVVHVERLQLILLYVECARPVNYTVLSTALKHAPCTEGVIVMLQRAIKALVYGVSRVNWDPSCSRHP